MDEAYQVYVNRVARMTLPATYETQLQHIQKSPKFEKGKAVPFPGYSAIAPPAEEDSHNSAFYSHLETIQQQLVEQLSGLLIPIPAPSFHLTVADLIWDNTYQVSVSENPNFDRQLHKCIEESFENYRQIAPKGSTSQLQLMGLMLLPRALTVALVPKNESDYEKILQLRRAIYQNSNLIALGIEQQYYFTGHITLGYFGEIPADLDRDRICRLLSAFNDRWLEIEPQILTIHQVQLRKFEDMTSYKREPHWPIVEI